MDAVLNDFTEHSVALRGVVWHSVSGLCVTRDVKGKEEKGEVSKQNTERHTQ
jgi:hypothetical protein